MTRAHRAVPGGEPERGAGLCGSSSPAWAAASAGPPPACSPRPGTRSWPPRATPKALDDLDVALRLPLDITDDASVAACVAAAGEIDALVNNAGVLGSGPVEGYPIDAAKATFEASNT